MVDQLECEGGSHKAEFMAQSRLTYWVNIFYNYVNYISGRKFNISGQKQFFHTLCDKLFLSLYSISIKLLYRKFKKE